MYWKTILSIAIPDIFLNDMEQNQTYVMGMRKKSTPSHHRVHTLSVAGVFYYISLKYVKPHISVNHIYGYLLIFCKCFCLS